MSDHSDSHAHPPYKVIFVLLCVFTAISWVADEAKDMMPSGAVLAVIVLAVAVAKALCVLLYFMHIKFERNWKYVLLAPTTILAIGLPLALLPDVGVHYYDVDVPQSPLADAVVGAGSQDDSHGESHH